MQSSLPLVHAVLELIPSVYVAATRWPIFDRFWQTFLVHHSRL